jgi:hypothetical protein
VLVALSCNSLPDSNVTGKAVCASVLCSKPETKTCSTSVWAYKGADVQIELVNNHKLERRKVIVISSQQKSNLGVK